MNHSDHERCALCLSMQSMAGMQIKHAAWRHEAGPSEEAHWCWPGVISVGIDLGFYYSLCGKELRYCEPRFVPPSFTEEKKP